MSYNLFAGFFIIRSVMAGLSRHNIPEPSDRMSNVLLLERKVPPSFKGYSGSLQCGLPDVAGEPS